MEWMKKPKVWIPASLVTVVLATSPFWLSSCSQEGQEESPAHIVIDVENAVMQKDGVKLKELTTPDYAKQIADLNDFSLNQGKQNNETLPSNWVLQEYKMNENLYVYHIHWVNELHIGVGGFYKVQNQGGKWKLDYLPSSEFDNMTEGMKPTRILRGTQS